MQTASQLSSLVLFASSATRQSNQFTALLKSALEQIPRNTVQGFNVHMQAEFAMQRPEVAYKMLTREMPSAGIAPNADSFSVCLQGVYRHAFGPYEPTRVSAGMAELDWVLFGPQFSSGQSLADMRSPSLPILLRASSAMERVHEIESKLQGGFLSLMNSRICESLMAFYSGKLHFFFFRCICSCCID